MSPDRGFLRGFDGDDFVKEFDKSISDETTDTNSVALKYQLAPAKDLVPKHRGRLIQKHEIDSILQRSFQFDGIPQPQVHRRVVDSFGRHQDGHVDVAGFSGQSACLGSVKKDPQNLSMPGAEIRKAGLDGISHGWNNYTSHSFVGYVPAGANSLSVPYFPRKS
jgi:hypothetical protein